MKQILYILLLGLVTFTGCATKTPTVGKEPLIQTKIIIESLLETVVCGKFKESIRDLDGFYSVYCKQWVEIRFFVGFTGIFGHSGMKIDGVFV